MRELENINLTINMKVEELIENLKKHNPGEEVRFYFLENYVLNGCELETIITADNQTEITIKYDNTSEGG